MAEIARFHWSDYLVLSVFIVISLAIGVYHALTGGKQKTTSEFIMANRGLAVLPAAVSMLISFKSALTMMGMLAEVYSYGIEFVVWINYVNVVGCSLAALVVVPWLYPLKLVSVYEVLYMGTAMYAPSFALESVTGFKFSTTVPLMAAVTIAYTALGGMKAVIWTDVFQFLVMIGGMLTILIKGTMLIGGFGEAISLCNEQGRLHWLTLTPDPRQRNTLWAFVFGVTANRIYMYGLTQTAVQRYSATTTMNKARLTILLNIPGRTFFNFITGTTGLVVTAYYAFIRCDPIIAKQVKNSNQILPYFVASLFSNSPGFSGLFMATLCGGALNTISSLLSGASANCWEDMLKWKLNYLSEGKKALITRVLVAMFGIVAVGVAFLAAKLPGPLTQLSNPFNPISWHKEPKVHSVSLWITLSLKTVMDGPLAGLFMLGGLTRLSNWKGALIGGICGVSVNIWLSAGAILLNNKHPALPPLPVDGCFSNRTLSFYSNTTTMINNEGFGRDYASVFFNQTTAATAITKRPLVGVENFYAISYLYVLLVGVIVTFVTGLIASLIFRNKNEDEQIDTRCLIPWRKAFDFSSTPQNSSNGEVHTDTNKNTIELNDAEVKLI